MKSHMGLRGEDIYLKVHHDPHRPFRTSRNPFDPSGPLGLLMTPYKPFNPSVSLRTHQPHMTPLDPSGPPQDQLRTTTGPLNTPSVLLGPLRTLQVPSGPLRIPYYDFINLLKNIILCRKMLVFNLSALHSLINISV